MKLDHSRGGMETGDFRDSHDPSFFGLPLRTADANTLQLAGAENTVLLGSNLSADSGAKTKPGPALNGSSIRAMPTRLNRSGCGRSAFSEGLRYQAAGTLTEVYENDRLSTIQGIPRNFMHIFISWSGEPSKRAALGLKSLLDDIFGDTANVFVSQHINPGENWTRRLGEALDQSEYGILCMTQENSQAPWMLFEAGAIAKKFGAAQIVPYLIGCLPDSLQGSPLAQFQSAVADREGTYALVKGISEALENPQEAQRLERHFARFWPDLEETIKHLPNPPRKDGAERSDREILEKILQQISLLVEGRKDLPVLPRTEMLHLLNLRDQPTLLYKVTDQLRKELRHLRDVGLIKNNGAIASLPPMFQLDKFFNLTDAGVRYLQESGTTK